jgi:hypothetical protein
MTFPVGTSTPSFCIAHRQATLGLETLVYSLVMRYLCDARFSPSSADQASIGVRWDLDDSNQAVSSALEDTSFTPVWQLSPETIDGFPRKDVFPPPFNLESRSGGRVLLLIWMHISSLFCHRIIMNEGSMASRCPPDK